MFSLLLIASSQPTPSRKESWPKHQNAVCKEYWVKIPEIENIGVRRVCIICYHLAVFVQGVLVFSKGFPLHAEQSYFECYKQQTTFDAKSKLAVSAHFVKFVCWSDPIELGLD